jgi:hypothetical protein
MVDNIWYESYLHNAYEQFIILAMLTKQNGYFI